MKNVFRTCAVGVGIAAMFATSALNAASFRSEKVAIPFDFQVSKKTMPAGEYRVQQGFGGGVAYLVNIRTGEQVQLLRAPGKSDSRVRLVFEDTGSGHVLKEIS